MKRKTLFYALLLCAVLIQPFTGSAKVQSYREQLEVRHMRDLEPEEKGFFEVYDAYLEDGKVFQLNCYSADISEVDIKMYDTHGNPVKEGVMTFNGGAGSMQLPEGCKVAVICWEDGKSMCYSYLP